MWVCVNDTCPENGIDKEGPTPEELTYPPMLCGWCWTDCEYREATP